MNLKVPRVILPFCCTFLSTEVKTIWGLLQPPFGGLHVGLKDIFSAYYLHNHIEICRRRRVIYFHQALDLD